METDAQMKYDGSDESGASTMYRSLLVHLNPAGENSSVLHAAGTLADIFDSHVIGLCAAQPVDILCDEGTAIRKASIRDRAAIEEDFVRCEAEFRSAFRSKTLEWRSAITYEILADYIAVQARSADLIISAGSISHNQMPEGQPAGIGQLAIKAGRPLLLVPQSARKITFSRSMVAWKDTREAKRAIHDAIPFLKMADEVTLFAVTGEQERLDAQAQLKDVAQWLKEHDVVSEVAVVSTKSAPDGYLHAEVLSRRCDFLVAGAYGHTRLDEWVFGGVTRDILLKAERLTLVSH
jgi:nucleotide-binding universal stress UspA family protein